MELQPHLQLADVFGIKDAIIVGDPARVVRYKTLLDDVEEMQYNREFKSIRGTYKGHPVLVVSTGVGAPSAAIAVEELNNLGVKRIIRVGSAGAMQKGIELGELIVANGVVRDDGLTPKYAPLNYPAVPSLKLLTKLCQLDANIRVGLVRSHDGFYMDDNAATEAFWSTKGVIGGDMESGALFVVGALRGIETLSILNNVVLYEADLAEGVNDLVSGDTAVADGEARSMKLALETLAG